MSLIQSSYMEELTGISSDIFSPAIISLAEAKAKEMLGFYELEEDKEKAFYLFSSTKVIDFDELGATIIKIEHRASVGDYTELVEDTDFRYIAPKKLIILEANLPEDTEVKVTFDIGWTMETIPAIAKFLVALLTIDTLNKFQPGTITTNEIDTKKLGDYMVKYHFGSGESSTFSIEQTIDYLATLIKSGSYERTAVI